MRMPGGCALPQHRDEEIRAAVDRAGYALAGASPTTAPWKAPENRWWACIGVPSNLAMALLGAAWIPMRYFLNLYLQQVLSYGAFAGGAALLPMTIAIMIGITVRLLGRFGARQLIASGLLVLAAGVAGLSLARPDGTFAIDVPSHPDPHG
jgi:hypothetical protein